MQANTYVTLAAERSESPLSGAGGGNLIGSGTGSQSGGTVTGRTNMEQEKRIRREIANSNERRRMQSINAGFQSLRTLLPHHEGEKLSKAAILQQTAEYIYQLEQEKTRLLSQNCQLKRLLNQQEGETVSGAGGQQSVGTTAGAGTGAGSGGPLASSGKKRKTDLSITELTQEVEADAASPGVIDMRLQLERERRLRMMLQDQVRQLETELYPERIREITHKLHLQYQPECQEEEVLGLSSSLNVREETAAAVASLVGTAASLPQVVALQPVAVAALQPVAHTETVIATAVSPPHSPRLPSILEAAIKAEPKVEVERLPGSSPAHSPGDGSNPGPPSPSDSSSDRLSRVYLASTSRQNLETIVEAIRHLEGDNLFTDAAAAAAAAAQDVPLALTTSQQQQASKVSVSSASTVQSVHQQQQHSTQQIKPPSDKHLLKFKMNQYLQFHQSPPRTPEPAIISGSQHTHQQQTSTVVSAPPPPTNRPGVIVVKQHT